MKFIKLSQRATVEHQGKYGWEPETVYDPVFIAPDHIESMNSAGLTYLRMASGERIEVRETPEEIIALINGDPSEEEVKFWSNLGGNSMSELTAALSTIEKCRGITNCPDGVDLQDWVKQLAAENVGLKDCVVNHAPAVEHWNSWADPEDKIQNAPETPATDRIYAEAEARGVDKLAMRRRAAAKVALDEFNDVKNHAELESEAWRAEMFAAELREGAK